MTLEEYTQHIRDKATILKEGLQLAEKKKDTISFVQSSGYELADAQTGIETEVDGVIYYPAICRAFYPPTRVFVCVGKRKLSGEKYWTLPDNEGIESIFHFSPVDFSIAPGRRLSLRRHWKEGELIISVRRLVLQNEWWQVGETIFASSHSQQELASMCHSLLIGECPQDVFADYLRDIGLLNEEGWAEDKWQ